MFNEWIKENFNFEVDFGRTQDDPYSRIFDVYKEEFDNEVEQLVNEYEVKAGRKIYALDEVWEKCKKFHDTTKLWYYKGFKEEELWQNGIEEIDYTPPSWLEMLEKGSRKFCGLQTLDGVNPSGSNASAMKVALQARNQYSFADGTCLKASYSTSDVLFDQWDRCLDDCYQLMRIALLTRDPLPEVKDAYITDFREGSNKEINDKESSASLSSGFTYVQMQKLLSFINDNSSGSIHANLTGMASFFNGNVYLLSVNKLIKDSKIYVGFDEDNCFIQDLKMEKIIGVGSESDMVILLTRATQIRDSFPLSSYKSKELGELVHLYLWAQSLLGIGSITTWDNMVEKFIMKFHHLSDHNEEEETKEDDNPYETDNVLEIFKIERNLFDFETPLCKAFYEFNYLLKIDTDLFTYDIQNFKTYDEYERELNNDIAKGTEEPWSENEVPYQLCDHICKPHHFKNGETKWLMCTSDIDGFCNGGKLPGMVRVRSITYFQDHRWYDKLADGKLKDETLALKAKIEGSWGDATPGVMKFCKWLNNPTPAPLDPNLSHERGPYANMKIEWTSNPYLDVNRIFGRDYDTQENQEHEEQKGIRNLVIRNHVGDLQLRIESYQTNINLEHPNWDAADYYFKEDYTIVPKPRAVIYKDRNDQRKLMRLNELHKFSDGTLTRVMEKLDQMVKDFHLFNGPIQ
ncbi:hypothetical protein Tco_0739925 [Tanacetum coccineum]